MRTTKEDLANGLEHIAYEMRMLVGSLSLARQRRMRLSLPADALHPNLLSLAVRASPIHLPALHASHLLAFFADEAPGPGYLLVRDYLPQFTIKEALASGLLGLSRRVAAQVAPLTVERVSCESGAGPHSYSFRPQEFFPLLECCSLFVDQLLASSWIEVMPPGLRSDWQETSEAIDDLVADSQRVMGAREALG